jgi:hypothetical protein
MWQLFSIRIDRYCIDLERVIERGIVAKLWCGKSIRVSTNKSTLITLLRVPYLCHFGSTSFVLPIRPKNRYSDNSIKSTVLMPFWQYYLSTADLAYRTGLIIKYESILNRFIRLETRIGVATS